MAAPGSPPSGKGLSYRDAGVDIDAGNALVKAIAPLAAATARRGVVGDLGGFGGLFDLKAAGYTDPILVAATDGVGTKVKLAIETGQHRTIGIDLVAMCVNDLVVQGAEPLFFLDYFAAGKLDARVAEQVVAGIAEGCRQAGAALIGGETAEMPGLYAGGDYDLAGFVVGAAERHNLLPRKDISPGDRLLGLASSGVHANGFSLVRRVIADAGLDWNAPAPFQDRSTLGQVFLEPTRIYARPLLDTIRATGAIKALAHITGGGMPENIPRILPDSVGARVDLGSLRVPPVFAWLAAAGRILPEELLRTFNCGVGMVVIVDAAQADGVAHALQAAGETAFPLGAVEAVEASDAHARVRFTGALDLAA